MPDTAGKMVLLGGDKLASDYCICVCEASVLTLQMWMVILGIRSRDLSFIFPQRKKKIYFVFHVRFQVSGFGWCFREYKGSTSKC